VSEAKKLSATALSEDKQSFMHRAGAGRDGELARTHVFPELRQRLIHDRVCDDHPQLSSRSTGCCANCLLIRSRAPCSDRG
jgi:hypothetical protein